MCMEERLWALSGDKVLLVLDYVQGVDKGHRGKYKESLSRQRGWRTLCVFWE